MKSARPFVGHTEEKWGGVAYEDLKADGVFDANGYPTTIPDNVVSIGNIWSTNRADNPDDRKGVYIFEYEGEGTVTVGGSGVKILSEEPGRIVFESISGKSFGLNITETDPNGTGNHLRDFTVVREEHVELFEAGAMFNPDWLPLIDDARQLRLMDWLETNNSTLSEWSERPTLDQASWMAEGVPVEVAVRLANELGTDAWFTVPHNATEEYIREFATYVRDNLDPRLKVSAEFSNEIWNYSFGQTKEILDEVRAEWGNGDVIGYGLKLQTEAALIWEEVFADEPDGRLQKVLAGQAFNSFNTAQLLDARGWFAAEPDAAILPSEVFDAFAITTYTGVQTLSSDEHKEQLLAAIADPDVDAMALLAEWLRDPDHPSSLPSRIERLAVQKQMADEAGLDFIAYEGGQHVHHRGQGELGEFLVEFNRSEYMADLYQELWDAWVELGDGPFMQFGDVGLATAFASFALRRSLDDTNPRAELLDELNATVPAWWENDREEGTFLHGVIREGGEGNDVLIGTSEEDYLIGRDGDDVFAPGRGDDGVHGGAGRDIVQVNGTIDQYSIEPIENGVRLIGPDGVDQLIDIEEIMFSDGTVARVEDLSVIVAPDPLPEPDPLPADPEPDPDPLPDDGEPDPLPVEPDPDPLPDQDPDSVYELQRGDLIESGSGMDAASFAGENGGLKILAINPSTALGLELGLDRDDHGYVVADKRAVAELGGEQVKATYWTVQENVASKGGPALSDTALSSALALGAVVTGVETITGSDRNDKFVGGAADDRFEGGGGDDIMLGRRGDDALFGGEGDDLLIGGEGDDTLSGGEGRDTAQVSGTLSDYRTETTDGGVLLIGADGADLLIDVEEVAFSDGTVARIENGALVSGEGERPDDEVDEPASDPETDPGAVYELQRGDMISGGDGFDTASFQSDGGGVRIMAINSSTAIGRELGLHRDDHGYVVADKRAVAELGGEQVKATYWTVQENMASKGGPALSDTALSSALALGAVVTGVEAVKGSEGNDKFSGGAADDRFEGGGGDDIMLGGRGDDALFGGEGDDLLVGGDGDDTLSGGGGRNTFVFADGDAGVDLVLDFGAGDVLDLSGYGFASIEDVVARASAVENGTRIDLSDQAAVVLEDAAPSTIEDITIYI